MTTQVWQTESHQKTPRDVADEFARSNWDKPRKVKSMDADNKFMVVDGVSTYQVTFHNMNGFAPDVYRVYRL